MSKVDLRVDFCSHEAAKYAVMHWHYSKAMPSGKLVKIGVWENSAFAGVIIFGMGATPEIAKPFGLKQMEVCELVRVALSKHESPTSQSLALAMNLLKKQSPDLRVIVSFADSAQNHHGGIYQATNWIFVGSENYHCYRVNGENVHPRSLGAKYGVGGQSIPWLRANVDPKAERITTQEKHKYVMPLDRAMRRQIEPLAKPYPKRADVGEIESRVSTTD